LISQCLRIHAEPPVATTLGCGTDQVTTGHGEDLPIADEIEFEKLRERKAKALRELLDELGYEPATPEELDAVRDEWK
jgi:hypothetical protein